MIAALLFCVGGIAFLIGGLALKHPDQVSKMWTDWLKRRERLAFGRDAEEIFQAAANDMQLALAVKEKLDAHLEQKTAPTPTTDNHGSTTHVSPPQDPDFTQRQHTTAGTNGTLAHRGSGTTGGPEEPEHPATS